MPRILLVGGGHAGCYATWHVEKRLRPGEAEVVVVDPRPGTTHQPFLPEVTAGSVEAPYPAVPRRRDRRRSTVTAGSAAAVEHASSFVQHPQGALVSGGVSGAHR